MGLRSRHVSEYFVVLQKRPLHAARTWRDHAIPDVWEERAEKAHPHSKPIGMQERLIRAVTQPGELVVDPAAGGYSVLEACVRCDRNFCGCDIEFGEEMAMNADERGRVTSAGKVETGAEQVRVTVTMTRGQHRALKHMATSKGETVSRLIREWAMEEGHRPDA